MKKLVSGLCRAGVVCGVLTCAGVAMAQGAPAAPAQPVPANPPAAALAPEESAVGVTKSSSWTITRSENGRTITLEGKDGAISAQVDGQQIPAERIERDGQTVRIKDDKGAVIFEQVVVEPSVAGAFESGPVMIQRLPRRARMFSGTLAQPDMRSGALVDPSVAIAGEPVEPPKVMIGVHLIDPDAALRGHFGLKEGEATLISGVYEGLPASAAGLEPYDIIVGIEGETVVSPDTVRKVLRTKEAGQSVQIEVLHMGVRRSVTLTPVAYDEARMSAAKVNAIAAAGAGDAEDIFQTLSVAPGAPGQVWTFNPQGGPMVGAVPGAGGKPHNQIFWKIDGNAGQQGDIARQAEEMAQKMAAQADAMAKQLGQTGNAAELNRRMEERMKKMEEMLRQMMERQATPPAPAGKDQKSDSQSWRAMSRRIIS